MTFVVEDGTGLDDANAYADVASVDAYFSARAVTTWIGVTSLKEAAILRATDYIEARFGNRFQASKLVSNQALSFPRYQLHDRDGELVEGVPTNLVKALSEYALRALTADLWNEPILDQHGKLVINRTQVGPILEDLRYAFNRDISIIKPVPGADRLLELYCFPTGVAIR